MQGQDWGGWGGPWISPTQLPQPHSQGMPALPAPGQGPTPPRCSSTPLSATSVVPGALSQGDARPGGRQKPGGGDAPPPAALRRQRRQGPSQALWPEQNILPWGSQSWQQLGQEQRPWHPAQRPFPGQAAHLLPGTTGWPGRGDPHCSPLPRRPLREDGAEAL